MATQQQISEFTDARLRFYLGMIVDRDCDFPEAVDDFIDSVNPSAFHALSRNQRETAVEIIDRYQTEAELSFDL